MQFGKAYGGFRQRLFFIGGGEGSVSVVGAGGGGVGALGRFVLSGRIYGLYMDICNIYTVAIEKSLWGT